MSIVSLATLKSYFEEGDFPTASQFEDLIDTLGLQNNFRTVEYTIGVPGVAGVDYNFPGGALDQANIRSVQLGGTTIIPENSPVIVIISKCIVGLNDAITGSVDIGNASEGSQFLPGATLDDTDEIVSTDNSTVDITTYVSASASSVYFSMTPSANWSTITTGTWKVWISYIDNSLL